MALPIELYDIILRLLADDSCFDDDLDTPVSPFNSDVPPYPAARSTLAKSCALVCKVFYDLAMPLIWQYLVVNSRRDLKLLRDISIDGPMRPLPERLTSHTRRVDFRIFEGEEDPGLAMELLADMQGLRVLTIDNEEHGTRMERTWHHPSCHAFLASIPTACPRLRRIQFLSIADVPSLEELAVISTGCAELQTLQLAAVNYRTVSEEDAEETDWYAWQDEDVDEELLISFPSLKRLCVGTGSFCGTLPSGVLSTRFVLYALRDRPDSTPQLRSLDLYIPFFAFTGSVMPDFAHFVTSSVYHLLSSTSVPHVTAYTSLRRLVVVVHGVVAELPTGLRTLEEVEFVMRRNIMRGQATTYNGRLRYAMDYLFNILLHGWCPSLRTVAIWKRVPGNAALVDSIVRSRVSEFSRAGIRLEARIPPRSLLD
ncbi:hypothetical protein NMY22_g6421 [Coprinellus aureogranulatus]|nr:hypothetical protein NMY22_g6421 [Coprinellus aureogranulatus]